MDEGTHHAYRFMRAGDYRTALVVGGDIGARFYDFSVNMSRMPPSEMTSEWPPILSGGQQTGLEEPEDLRCGRVR